MSVLFNGGILLNDEPSGGGETWYFNKTLIEGDSYGGSFNFLSANHSYHFMSYYRDPEINMVLEYSGSGTHGVYYQAGIWTNEAYRTIILEEPASGDFLTWLQRNATKIS